MKNRKTLCFVLSVILIITSMMSVRANESGVGRENSKSISLDKKICTATIEDNFADDSVLVVINKEYSKRDTVFTASHFPAIQADEV